MQELAVAAPGRAPLAEELAVRVVRDDPIVPGVGDVGAAEAVDFDTTHPDPALAERERFVGGAGVRAQEFELRAVDRDPVVAAVDDDEPAVVRDDESGRGVEFALADDADECDGQRARARSGRRSGGGRRGGPSRGAGRRARQRRPRRRGGGRLSRRSCGGFRRRRRFGRRGRRRLRASGSGSAPAWAWASVPAWASGWAPGSAWASAPGSGSPWARASALRSALRSVPPWARRSADAAGDSEGAPVGDADGSTAAADGLGLGLASPSRPRPPNAHQSTAIIATTAMAAMRKTWGSLPEESPFVATAAAPAVGVTGSTGTAGGTTGYSAVASGSPPLAATTASPARSASPAGVAGAASRRRDFLGGRLDRRRDRGRRRHVLRRRLGIGGGGDVVGGRPPGLGRRGAGAVVHGAIIPAGRCRSLIPPGRNPPEATRRRAGQFGTPVVTGRRSATVGCADDDDDSMRARADQRARPKRFATSSAATGSSDRRRAARRAEPGDRGAPARVPLSTADHVAAAARAAREAFRGVERGPGPGAREGPLHLPRGVPRQPRRARSPGDAREREDHFRRRGRVPPRARGRRVRDRHADADGRLQRRSRSAAASTR